MRMRETDSERSSNDNDPVTPLQRLTESVRRFAVGAPLRPHGRETAGTTERPPSAVTEEAGVVSERIAAIVRYDRAYFRRWLLIGALIGVVAGIGAIIFYEAIALCSQFLLGDIAGFYPPNPASEGATIALPALRPWLIPVVTTLGGLVTGIIVFSLAPEAEGHGTDAAIEAFHEKNGYIRARIPLVKLVASAITIGSGGSAGREGPTAQISAGFGSWLATLLHLDDHDRRIAMAAGIGSGIGAIFKAPIGGAILSSEILYKRDFEADALFPSFIASVIGFSIYGAWSGWTPVFGLGGHFTFTHPLNLIAYLILGVCAGGVGLLYPKALYGVRDFFVRLRIPRFLKPAIGGLLVGLIGLAAPQALGMGYGYVQFGVNSDYFHLAAWLMAALIFVKIITTSLTIGSGGSGGVFGPGMVIGGFLGGALWALLHAIAPWMVTGMQPGAFVVVGMGAFFGGIAKAPLAVILMVAEMTGEYALIVPAMLATMVAYLVSGDTSIYEKQVPTRLDSPAHRDDFALLLEGAQGVAALQGATLQGAPRRKLPRLSLRRRQPAPDNEPMPRKLRFSLRRRQPAPDNDPMRRLRVSDAMQTRVVTTLETEPFGNLRDLVEERGYALVLNAQRTLVGIVTQRDVRAHDADPGAQRLTAGAVAARPVITTQPDESLQAAIRRMTRLGLRQLAVVSQAESGPTPVGVLRRSDALAAYVDTLVVGDAQPSRDSNGGDMPNLAAHAHSGEAQETRATLAAGGAPARMAEANMTPSATRMPTPAGAGRTVAPDAFTSLRVEDAMQRAPVIIAETVPVEELREAVYREGAALVVDSGGVLVGIIAARDLRERGIANDGKRLLARDIATRNLVTARRRERLRVAIRRMVRAGLRQLPVLEGEAPGVPIGLLRRSDALSAFDRVTPQEERAPLPAESGASASTAPHPPTT